MIEGNLVLCGPMVRRVERKAVSVFVVTRKKCEVTLKVYKKEAGRRGEQLLQGQRTTISLGSKGGVNAVVVTAREGTELTWGESYLYELSFTVDGKAHALHDDGVMVSKRSMAPAMDLLVYGNEELPGFTLPPEEPANLRVLHGSCRKPHGAGEDALSRADFFIKESLESVRKPPRPQQLFLTGDQIYADDVHSTLLLALRDFARREIGDDEERGALRGISAKLEPGNRTQLCREEARLSSGSCSSHLITVAEFYAMYLFAWSPEPWSHATSDAASRALPAFSNRLREVRRAFANLATYMIFDDHEITDDWYIRDEWSNRVLGKPLGRRIIRNGLAAYLVFQHWGNSPDDFELQGQFAGALTLIDGWSGFETNADKLEAMLHVPKRGAGHVEDPIGRIDWSWRWQGPNYEVIALDTRTHRSFDGNKLSLLREADIDRALRPDNATRFRIVLSAAPILGVELLERVQAIASSWGRTEKLDDEAWSHSPSFNHLLAKLLERAPVIALSGDVHYGFGASLFNKAKPNHRIVNFTSSSLKNMSGRLANLGFSMLNFGTDNELQAAMLHDFEGTATLVATKRTFTMDGQDLEEEILTDGQALLVDSQKGRDPSTVLQGAERRDRTDISGYCNIGDIRLDPQKNKVTQDIWYRKDGEWKCDTQTARFWLANDNAPNALHAFDAKLSNVGPIVGLAVEEDELLGHMRRGWVGVAKPIDVATTAREELLKIPNRNRQDELRFIASSLITGDVAEAGVRVMALSKDSYPELDRVLTSVWGIGRAPVPPWVDEPVLGLPARKLEERSDGSPMRDREWLEAVTRRSCRVWRVLRSSNREHIGSGVLVNGGWFHHSHVGQTLLLTCAHVCSPQLPEGNASPLLAPEDAMLDWWSGNQRRPDGMSPLLPTLGDTVWQSSQRELDAVLFKVEDMPSSIEDEEAPSVEAVEGDRIYLWGYPEKKSLAFAVESNQITSLEHPYLSYDFLTPGGVSGGGVFHADTHQLIGLHRSKNVETESRRAVSFELILRTARSELAKKPR